MLYIIGYITVAFIFWLLDALFNGITMTENDDFKPFENWKMWVFWPAGIMFLLGVMIKIIMEKYNANSKA